MTTSPLVIECNGKTAVFYDRCTIGRHGDYAIQDEYASPHHVVLWPGAKGWLAADLGSTNGTYLNDVKVWGPRPLAKGDRLRVGRTVITVVPALGPSAADLRGEG